MFSLMEMIRRRLKHVKIMVTSFIHHVLHSRLLVGRQVLLVMFLDICVAHLIILIIGVARRVTSFMVLIRLCHFHIKVFHWVAVHLGLNQLS
jgi:hypothetical protein